MIVGTAGHIDHGKTTLVRVLTGVDTDRLPEEKKRGISIELGYAFLDTPARGRIGFVDVPGHERLVHTMISGATGIDCALLLVAADDGVMPQTREHLAVLSLLGIDRAAVVVTKADRADAARIDAVCAEAGALLHGTALAGSPVHVVSATSGQGVEGLKAWLFEAAAQSAARAAADAAFRLAIDRAFTLDGVGMVVTGTVHAGRVAVGDELRLVPGERSVRVRSLHAQNRVVAQAEAGQRCAVGLVGVAKDQVERGQWVVAAEAAQASERIDVTLSLWHGETAPLRSGQTVHVHLGAADVLGSVAVLDGDRIAPGQQARAQLVLRQRIGAWYGDRVVLRDASATRTLAGGTVLDPLAPARYRRTPQRLGELHALATADRSEHAAAVLAAAPQGLELARFEAAQGRSLPWPDDALRSGGWIWSASQAQGAEDAVLQALAHFHERQPEELGPDAARLRRLALPRLNDVLFRALLARLQSAGRLNVRGAFVHLPEHGVRLSASEERIAQKVAPRLAEAGFEGAWARDLARDCAESEPLMRTTLARLAQRGELHQVVKDLYYPAVTMATLAGIARQVAQQADGVVTAASFRDATQLGRKRAIQVLEYLDRVGVTRRVGDVHRVRSDSVVFAPGAA